MSTTTQLNKLIKLQNQCVGLIDKTKSIEDNYKLHKILTLDKLVKLENYKIWYKYYQGLLPKKIDELMSSDASNTSIRKTHNYSTWQKSELNLPKATNELYRNSFYVRGLKDFANLPMAIKSQKNYGIFVKECKNFLLNDCK